MMMSIQQKLLNLRTSLQNIILYDNIKYSVKRYHSINSLCISQKFSSLNDNQSRNHKSSFFSPFLLNKKSTYFSFSKSFFPKKIIHTKYRITVPLDSSDGSSNSTFDDIFLSSPSRDDFVKFTKDNMIFLRFLKVYCDVGKRSHDFHDFVKRCSSGFIVEKDIYLTKNELIQTMWKNGFSENEISAFEFSFPNDYNFHYPELAVLFEIKEEDCYKFCLKKRTETPEKLVELKYKPPKNLLSSYGLAFLIVWLGFSNTVLSNAWFYSKTFPFLAVFYMLASHFYRQIREYLSKDEKTLLEIAKNNKINSDELILSQLKKYAGDVRCLDYLGAFRKELEQQMASYRKALILQQKAIITDRVNHNLQKILNAERKLKTDIEEKIIEKAVESFNDEFSSSFSFRQDALNYAIEAFSNESDAPKVDKVASVENSQIRVDDPVGKYFLQFFGQLKNGTFSDTTKIGEIFKKLQDTINTMETAIFKQFTVSKKEASEITQISAKCKTSDGFDLSVLGKKEFDRLNELYGIINSRLGLEFLNERNLITPLESSEKSCDGFIKSLNDRVKLDVSAIKEKRLILFLQAF